MSSCGMYGMWDGGKKWSDVIIHQGFVIASNDGVIFREPARTRFASFPFRWGPTAPGMRAG